MLIVLDTNVIVSALINPYGVPGSILSLMIDEKLTLCYDARILLEYEEVLCRPKFRFDSEHVLVLLSVIRENGQAVIASAALIASVTDRDDQPFAQVAKASNASYLITGNSGHFPNRIGDTKVVSPSVFIKHCFKNS